MGCPKAGKRVTYIPKGLDYTLHARGYCKPTKGEGGAVTSLPIGGRRSTCMPGPGGGLVYVKWDQGCVAGVPAGNIQSGHAALAGAHRKKRR